MKSIIKKFKSKKIVVPALLISGVLLTVAFLLSPQSNIWAQQTSEKSSNTITKFEGQPDINGSVSVREGIENFFEQNVNVPFITAAQTAQQQTANGTVLAGHLGVTKGYLTYTFSTIDSVNDTLHKVIVDAGNGQVLYASEGQDIGAYGHPPFGKKGQGFGFGPLGHEGFGPRNHHEFRGGPWHGLFGQ